MDTLLQGYGDLDLQSIQYIIKNCVGLTDINLSANHFSDDSINYLTSNLEPKVEKLSLGQIKEIRNEHVTTLVQRCNKLKVIYITITIFAQRLDKASNSGEARL